MDDLWFWSVCSPSERAAAAGLHLVRRFAGFPAEKHAVAEPGSDPNRSALPALFDPVHPGAAFARRQDTEETVHQIHLPFGLVLFISL